MSQFFMFFKQSLQSMITFTHNIKKLFKFSFIYQILFWEILIAFTSYG